MIIGHPGLNTGSHLRSKFTVSSIANCQHHAEVIFGHVTEVFRSSLAGRLLLLTCLQRLLDVEQCAKLELLFDLV